MDKDVIVDRRGGVSVIMISRETKRNALKRSTMQELRRLFIEQERDGAVAIVLTGSTKIFSAGVDLSELGRGIQDLAVDDEIMETVETIRRLRVPVICAIEGPCFGAAVEIAMACDLRVTAKGAYFSIPATRLGLLYRPGAVAKLVSTLGESTVIRLLIFNERISAEEALTAGIATHLVEPGVALETAFALAGELSSSTADAVSATKRLINELSEVQENYLHWDEVRRSLLTSEARSRALSNARTRLGHESFSMGIDDAEEIQ